MHYRRAAEQNTRDTHDQIKAKEEETTTATFTSGEYASLCRGDTSKVPVLSPLSICSAVMASKYNWNDTCKPTSNSHSKPTLLLITAVTRD